LKERKQKTKTLRGYGHINVSNVNSETSECITLTYAIAHVGTIANATKLKAELDNLHEQEAEATVEISKFGDKESDVSMKYKIKTCESEKLARDTKKTIDLHLKKKGGQTTLTEDFDREAEEITA
jgi:hypothetical protein